MSVVTHREILRFYLPLLLTSQMMTLSGPLINVAVGRAADPKLDLAAYWIGFSILMLLEAPALTIQQVTATLLTGYSSFRRLLAGSVLIGIAAAIGALIVATTPLRDIVFLDLIHTTPRVAARAAMILAILCPVPILIALRGLANGIAIRERKTLLIARATASRLLVIATVVGFTVGLATGSGAFAGAAALLAGLVSETTFVLFAVAPLVRRRRDESLAGNDEQLSWADLGRVALPLAMSAYGWTLSRPIVNAILGRLPDPELAQAGFGVVAPLVLLTCSPLWALHNVPLVLAESNRDLRRLLRFTVVLSLLFAVLILFLAIDPFRGIILGRAFSLSTEMQLFIAPALFLIIAEPFLLASRSFAQGILMKSKRMRVVGVSSVLKILLIATTGLLIVEKYPNANGVFIGTALFLGGDLVDAALFGLRAWDLVRRGELFEEGRTG